MRQVNYVFDAVGAASELAQAMKIDRLSKQRAQWRRIALASFGLFMASVIGNIVLILGR